MSGALKNEHHHGEEQERSKHMSTRRWVWVKLRGLPNSLLAYAEHLRTPITLLVVPNTLHSTRATAFQVAAFGAHLQVLLGAAHVAQPPADGLEWAEELVERADPSLPVQL